MIQNEKQSITPRGKKVLMGIGTVAAGGGALLWGLTAPKPDAQPKNVAPAILQIESLNGLNQGPLFKVTEGTSPDPGSEVAKAFADAEGFPDNQDTTDRVNEDGVRVGEAMAGGDSPAAANAVQPGDSAVVAPTENLGDDAIKQLEATLEHKGITAEQIK